MNIAWAIQGIVHKQATSQVVLVPCLLWYIGLVLRDDGFFLSSKGVEISVVVCMHLLLTGALVLAHRLRSKSQANS